MNTVAFVIINCCLNNVDCRLQSIIAQIPLSMSCYVDISYFNLLSRRFSSGDCSPFILLQYLEFKQLNLLNPQKSTFDSKKIDYNRWSALHDGGKQVRNLMSLKFIRNLMAENEAARDLWGAGLAGLAFLDRIKKS